MNEQSTVIATLANWQTLQEKADKLNMSLSFNQDIFTLYFPNNHDTITCCHFSELFLILNALALFNLGTE